MIQLMGKFTAIGMRARVTDPEALIVNTCSGNDTSEIGDDRRWSWANPTNRIIPHPYQDIVACSVEALWQGTKLLAGQDRPDPDILQGNWRKHKGKRPAGAYAGPGQPLITNPGEARRKIYIPAFDRLVQHWLQHPEVRDRLDRARQHPGPVFLRDHDTGRGIDRNGPLSHAWVLAYYLNHSQWPV